MAVLRLRLSMSQQVSTIWARWTRVWSKEGDDHDDTEKLGECPLRI